MNSLVNSPEVATSFNHKHREHWSVQQLKRLINPKRQITYGIVQAGPNVENGIPYVRPTDMDDERGIFDFPSLLRTTKEIAISYERSSLREGDLVCSIGPSFGKVMIVPNFLEGGNLTQGTALIAINAPNHPRFFFWCLRSGESVAQWEASIGGATFRALNLGPLAETLVCVPPPSEQAAIAAFLDCETGKIDALVAEQERLIALLKEKRQAVISHAVTKGLNPDAPMKDSGVPWLGEVPAHWGVSKLSRIAKIGNGSTPNRDNSAYWLNGSYPWLNSSHVNRDIISDSSEHVTQLALRECHLPIVVPPAVLIGITGQGRTRGMASPLTFEATINQHVAYLKPWGSKLSATYVLNVLRHLYDYLRAESDGGGATKGAITCEQLSALQVPLPDPEEQKAISSHIEVELDKLKTFGMEATRAITLLRERRAALISAAVTGKIDVRDTVPAVQDAE